MIARKMRILPLIAAVAVSSGVAAGCSFSASVGSISEKVAVAKHDVETAVATQVAQKANTPTPRVACPGDLNGTVGTVMYCTLTASGDTASYPVKVTVTSVKGTAVNFDILVSTTPGHFTAPS